MNTRHENPKTGWHTIEINQSIIFSFYEEYKPKKGYHFSHRLNIWRGLKNGSAEYRKKGFIVRKNFGRLMTYCIYPIHVSLKNEKSFGKKRKTWLVYQNFSHSPMLLSSEKYGRKYSTSFSNWTITKKVIISF